MTLSVNAVRLVCAAALLQLVCACALAEQVERTAAADPLGEVEVVNVSGDVRIMGWSRPQIEVKADLGSGVERLDFHRDGRRTLVKVVPSSGARGGGASTLEIHAPEGSALRVNTVSADQTIRGMRGVQSLQAVSGSIKTEAFGAELRAQTVSGDIELRSEGGGPVRATTVSGDMRLQGVGPELELNSVSGDIEANAERLSRVRIETTNGDMRLSGALTRDARFESEAINGDLSLMLAGAIDAQFDIETFNGDIDVCFGPEPSRSREYGPGSELHFRHGEGAARVRIKSLNGAIEVCNK